jgi:antitoxin ParD1/3/4
VQPDEELSITLPVEMANFIQGKVSLGLYGANSEIIREALRGWIERERRLEMLDTGIVQGIADAEAGRVQDIDEIHAQLREQFTTNYNQF